MANGAKLVNSHNYFSKIDALSSAFPVAIRDGQDLCSFIIEAKTGQITTSHPKLLKDDLNKIISDQKQIESLYCNRQGKLIITTRNVVTAQEILKIESILNTPVTAFIQTETITSRFLLRIESAVSCEDIAGELEEQGLAVHEVRRFVRLSAGISTPTQSVLVTIYGTSIPSDVKLWMQRHRLQLFIDRPRQCLKCLHFNHATKACRNERHTCKKCAQVHDGVCASTTLLCTNCKGHHSADDKNCPAYIQESNLQKFRSENHLTLREARRLFRPRPSDSLPLYSKVVAGAAEESIKKSELESALNSLSTQFTTLVQSMVAELHKAMVSMVEAIAQPIKGIIQELQVKKVVTTKLEHFSKSLDTANKRFKSQQNIQQSTGSPMDTRELSATVVVPDKSGNSTSQPGVG